MSSNRDGDGQLGALEMPQTTIFIISSTLEALVHLLGNRVWDLDPRIGRVEVGCDLSLGSVRDSGFEGHRPASPRDGIDDSVVGGPIVRVTAVQVGILHDGVEVREVDLLEVLLSNVENLGHVHNLADSENTAQRVVSSSIILGGVKEESPV